MRVIHGSRSKLYTFAGGIREASEVSKMPRSETKGTG